jgi:hypothetical protein
MYELYAWVCRRGNAIPGLDTRNSFKVLVDTFDTLEKAQKAAEDKPPVYINAGKTILAHENQLIAFSIKEVV